MFTALGFFMLLKKLTPEPTMTIDTDWFYRKGSRVFMRIVDSVIAVADNFVSEAYDILLLGPAKRFASFCSVFDLGVIDGMVNNVAWIRRLFSWGWDKVDI